MHTRDEVKSQIQFDWDSTADEQNINLDQYWGIQPVALSLREYPNAICCSFKDSCDKCFIERLWILKRESFKMQNTADPISD